MSDQQNAPESDSVERMIDSLASWFTAPVKKTTPQSKLDQILAEIMSSDSETDGSVTAVQFDALSEALPEANPEHSGPDQFENIRFWLEPLLVDLKETSRMLFPLTDWEQASLATFRMTLHDLNSQRRVLLEAQSVSEHRIGFPLPVSTWTLHLRNSEDNGSSRSLNEAETVSDNLADRSALARKSEHFMLFVIAHGPENDLEEIHLTDPPIYYSGIETHKKPLPYDEVHFSSHPPLPDAFLILERPAESRKQEKKAVAAILEFPRTVTPSERGMQNAFHTTRECISLIIEEMAR